MPFWARTFAVLSIFGVLEGVGWWTSGLAVDPHVPWLLALAGRVAALMILGLLVAASTSKSHLAYKTALAGLDPAQRSAAVDATFAARSRWMRPSAMRRSGSPCAGSSQLGSGG